MSEKFISYFFLLHVLFFAFGHANPKQMGHRLSMGPRWVKDSCPYQPYPNEVYGN